MRMKIQVRQALRQLWWGFRQVMGDAAYERYLESLSNASHRPECRAAPKSLTREEFYLDALRRRYSGVSRCC